MQVDGKYAVDVSAKCAAAPVGARIITLDRQLKGPFKLIKTLDDPRCGQMKRLTAGPVPRGGRGTCH